LPINQVWQANAGDHDHHGYAHCKSPKRQSYLPSSIAKDIRVLIIDDHMLVRNGLRILLESHDGITVVGEASNAAKALATIISERPDIILLDSMWPATAICCPNYTGLPPRHV